VLWHPYHTGLLESVTTVSTSETNRFLDSLPIEEMEAIREATEFVHLNIGEVLYEKDGRIAAYYFPRECVVSITNVLGNTRQEKPQPPAGKDFVGSLGYSAARYRRTAWWSRCRAQRFDWQTPNWLKTCLISPGGRPSTRTASSRQ
jgi:hypothetical protein